MEVGVYDMLSNQRKSQRKTSLVFLQKMPKGGKMLLRVCLKCGEIFGCRDENGDLLCCNCEFQNNCEYQKELAPPKEMARFATLGFCPNCLPLLLKERRKYG